MPGAYAHMTLVNQSLDQRKLDELGFPERAKDAAGLFLNFCELGSVSPDYPYLVFEESSKRWADAMHYTRTGGIVRAGVRALREMRGDAQLKCLAWLFGYASHVVADVTIHPVLDINVCTYAEHPKLHRICEMHQDVYIFQRMRVGGVGEHLKTGIRSCVGKGKTIYSNIDRFWSSLLQEVHPAEYAANKPGIKKWHERFCLVIDAIDEGDHLPEIFQHMLSEQGAVYPSLLQVKSSYLTGMRTPGGARPLHYDEIFDQAVLNARKVQLEIARGVFEGGEEYASLIQDWNLDTGKVSENGPVAFWEG
ncbi:hypothetical protein EPN96_00955 [bacterium]|nr:MAG: hypothetical protein EPN96_00955 [bacterium]